MGVKFPCRFCIVLWLCLDQVSEGRTPSERSLTSVTDANLMFEFLLGGVELDLDNNVALLDKEMASMRSGRTFLSSINDNIPKSVDSMLQMATAMETHRRKPLTVDRFESLVLSMVYSAYQAHYQDGTEKQEAWADALLQLANITIYELRGSHLFNFL